MHVRLFNRTTRSVALTEAGTKLLGTLAPAWLRFAIRTARGFSERPHGLLRINTARAQQRLDSGASRHLASATRRSLSKLRFDNNLSDIVAGGFDAGIRLGHLLQRDVIAVPLGADAATDGSGFAALLQTSRNAENAARTARARLHPSTAESGRFFAWEFRIGGKDVTVDVRGRLVLDEMRAVLGAACQSSGLGLVFRQFAAAEIASGAVVPILDAFLPPDQPFHLYYANRAHTPSKLRAFIEFMRAVNRKVPK